MKLTGKTSPSQRFISLVVLLCFVTTSVAWSAPAVPASQSHFANLQKISVPQEIGRVEELFIPQSANSETPVIVYLQDAHANLGAQANIAKLAELLGDELKVSAILKEGGSGEADLSALRTFGDSSIKDSVTDFWMKEGVLSGIEREAIVGTKSYRFFGIENQADYETGSRYFVETRNNSKLFFSNLETLETRNKSNQKKVFNPDLLKFEETVDKFESKHEIVPLVELIANEARNRHINRWKYSEVEKFIDLIVTEMNGGPSERLFEIQRTIDSKKLFSEIELLKTEVKEVLFGNKKERVLDQEGQILKNLRAFVSLEATPQDVAFFERNESMIRKYAGKKKLDLKAIESSSKFYNSAKKRDDVLFSNIKQILETEKIKRAFLVAGGFHSQAVTEEFRKHNMAYVIVSPQISDENNYEAYYARISGKRATLDYFQSHFKPSAISAAHAAPAAVFNPVEVKVIAGSFESRQVRAVQGPSPKIPGTIFIPQFVRYLVASPLLTMPAIILSSRAETRMLVLTRKKGEKIIIGDDIEIVLLGINEDKIRLRLKAPVGIPIQRKELTTKEEPQTDGSFILTRKADEQIIIGNNISVMVVRISDDQARLGINAPKNISVHRQEIYDAIKKGKSGRRAETRMLVLSRKKNEKIIIGRGDDKIEIVLSDIRGSEVSIGINAPSEVPIWRAELLGQKTASLPHKPKANPSGFLFLSRKVDQKIIIGEKISIMVVSIRDDKVRLGIDAPKEIPVHRLEIYEAIEKEKEANRRAEARSTAILIGTGIALAGIAGIGFYARKVYLNLIFPDYLARKEIARELIQKFKKRTQDNLSLSQIRELHKKAIKEYISRTKQPSSNIRKLNSEFMKDLKGRTKGKTSRQEIEAIRQRLLDEYRQRLEKENQLEIPLFASSSNELLTYKRVKMQMSFEDKMAKAQDKVLKARGADLAYRANAWPSDVPMPRVLRNIEKPTKKSSKAEPAVSATQKARKPVEPQKQPKHDLNAATDELWGAYINDDGFLLTRAKHYQDLAIKTPNDKMLINLRKQFGNEIDKFVQELKSKHELSSEQFRQLRDDGRDLATDLATTMTALQTAERSRRKEVKKLEQLQAESQRRERETEETAQRKAQEAGKEIYALIDHLRQVASSKVPFWRRDQKMVRNPDLIEQDKTISKLIFEIAEKIDAAPVPEEEKLGWTTYAVSALNSAKRRIRQRERTRAEARNNVNLSTAEIDAIQGGIRQAFLGSPSNSFGAGNSVEFITDDTTQTANFRVWGREATLSKDKQEILYRLAKRIRKNPRLSFNLKTLEVKFAQPVTMTRADIVRMGDFFARLFSALAAGNDPSTMTTHFNLSNSASRDNATGKITLEFNHDKFFPRPEVRDNLIDAYRNEPSFVDYMTNVRMNEFVGKYPVVLDLYKQYVTAFEAGKKDEAKQVEKEINKYIDQFNAFKEPGIYADHLGDFDLNKLVQAPVAKVASSARIRIGTAIVNFINYFLNWFGTSLNYYWTAMLMTGHSIKNIKRMEDLILRGEEVPEDFAAGAATRLGLGNMFTMSLQRFYQVLSNPESVIEGLAPDVRGLLASRVAQIIALNPEMAELTMGARMLIQRQVMIEQILRRRYPRASIFELRLKIEEAIKNQKISLLVNEDVVDDVINLLIRNNFYNFNRNNIYFTVQPTFSGYVPQNGKIIYHKQSQEVVNGHGYPTMQKFFPGQSFRINAQNERQVISRSLVEELSAAGVKLLSINRINDISKYESWRSIIDGNSLDVLTLLAMVKEMGGFESLDQPEQGAEQVVELVDNPNKQKGGLFPATAKLAAEGLGFMPDTLAFKDAESVHTIERIEKEIGGGMPYNAMRQSYKLAALVNRLQTGTLKGIQIYIRFREFTKGEKFEFAAETVTGDTTYMLKTAAVSMPGRKIRDFKTAAEIPLIVEAFGLQNEALKWILRAEVRTDRTYRDGEMFNRQSILFDERKKLENFKAQHPNHAQAAQAIYDEMTLANQLLPMTPSGFFYEISWADLSPEILDEAEKLLNAGRQFGIALIEEAGRPKSIRRVHIAYDKYFSSSWFSIKLLPDSKSPFIKDFLSRYVHAIVEHLMINYYNVPGLLSTVQAGEELYTWRVTSISPELEEQIESRLRSGVGINWSDISIEEGESNVTYTATVTKTTAVVMYKVYTDEREVTGGIRLVIKPRAEMRVETRNVLNHEEFEAEKLLFRHLGVKSQDIPQGHVLVVLGNPYPGYAASVVRTIHELNSPEIVIVGKGNAEEPERVRIRREILAIDPSLATRIKGMESVDESMHTGMNVTALAQAVKDQAVASRNFVLTQIPTGELLSLRIFEHQWQQNAEKMGIAARPPTFYAYPVDFPFALKEGQLVSSSERFYLEHAVGQIERLRTWPNNPNPPLVLQSNDLSDQILKAEQAIRNFLSRAEVRAMIQTNQLQTGRRGIFRWVRNLAIAGSVAYVASLVVAYFTAPGPEIFTKPPVRSDSSDDVMMRLINQLKLLSPQFKRGNPRLGHVTRRVLRMIDRSVRMLSGYEDLGMFSGYGWPKETQEFLKNLLLVYRSNLAKDFNPDALAEVMRADFSQILKESFASRPETRNKNLTRPEVREDFTLEKLNQQTFGSVSGLTKPPVLFSKFSQPEALEQGFQDMDREFLAFLPSEGHYSVTLKIGGTTLAAKVLDSQGRFVYVGDAVHTYQKADKSDTSEEILNHMAAAILKVIAKVVDAEKVPYEKIFDLIETVGISSPGPFVEGGVDFSGTFKSNATNIPFKPGISVRQEIFNRLRQSEIMDSQAGDFKPLPIPNLEKVEVLHDAMAGAKGEQSRYGTVPGAKKFLYVIWGSGIGASIYVDGEPFPGGEIVDNMLGEIGHHLVVAPGGDHYEWIASRTKGVLAQDTEQFKGYSTIEKRIAGLALKDKVLAEMGKPIEELTPEDVANSKVLRNAGHEMGQALAVLIKGLRATYGSDVLPDDVIIGSGVSHLGEPLRKFVEEGFDEEIARAETRTFNRPAPASKPLGYMASMEKALTEDGAVFSGNFETGNSNRHIVAKRVGDQVVFTAHVSVGADPMEGSPFGINSVYAYVAGFETGALRIKNDLTLSEHAGSLSNPNHLMKSVVDAMVVRLQAHRAGEVNNIQAGQEEADVLNAGAAAWTQLTQKPTETKKVKQKPGVTKTRAKKEKPAESKPAAKAKKPAQTETKTKVGKSARTSAEPVEPRVMDAMVDAGKVILEARKAPSLDEMVRNIKNAASSVAALETKKLSDTDFIKTTEVSEFTAAIWQLMSADNVKINDLPSWSHNHRDVSSLAMRLRTANKSQKMSAMAYGPLKSELMKLVNDINRAETRKAWPVMKPEEILVIGVGFVGSTLAVLLTTDYGHDVIGLDIKEDLVKKLQGDPENGVAPELNSYIPDLQPLLEEARASGRLNFTTDYEQAVEGRKYIFLALLTPENESGEANISYLESAVRQVAQLVKSGEEKIFIVKSTAPPGTEDKLLRAANEELAKRTFDQQPAIYFARMPEFLREGQEVVDARGGSGREVAGAKNPEILKQIESLFNSKRLNPAYPHKNVPIVLMDDDRSAAMVKYAANGYRALKISFINFISWFTEELGLDIDEVANAIGEDPRIVRAFLNCGLGYGGSCFPKDVQAFTHMATKADVPPGILLDAQAVNDFQWRNFLDNIIDKLGDLKGKQIAVLGASFKPNTSDVREARSHLLIERLIAGGAHVRVFDPKATRELERTYFQRDRAIEYEELPVELLSPELALTASETQNLKADAIILVTEWPQFKNLDFEKLKKEAEAEGRKLPYIFDGRNLWKDTKTISDLGFQYFGIGRPIGKRVLSDREKQEFIQNVKELFLALRVSYVNMLAEIANREGANVRDVLKGFGFDPVVSSAQTEAELANAYLSPGLGFGGYNLPASLDYFERLAKKYLPSYLEKFRQYRTDFENKSGTTDLLQANGTRIPFITSIREINPRQVDLYLQKARLAVGGSLKGKKVAVLGLAFKSGTFAIVNSPSIELINKLLTEGAIVTATDPDGQAVTNMERRIPASAQLSYVGRPEDAVKGTDVQFLAIASPDYRNWRNIFLLKPGKPRANQLNVIDGRHFYDPKKLRAAGIHYFAVGVPDEAPRAEVRSILNNHLYDSLVEGVGEHTVDWLRMNVIASVILNKIRERSQPVILEEGILTVMQKKMIDQGIAEHVDTQRVVEYIDIPALVQRMVNRGFLRKADQGYELAVEPQVFAVKYNDIRYIKKEFETHLEALANKAPGARTHLIHFIHSYSEAVDRWKRYPIESRYPVLKAILLMSQEDRERLLNFVTERKAVFGKQPLVDSIILMLNTKVPEDWLLENAPAMVGRKVFNITPEAINAAGGLGRVEQSHGIAFQRLAGKHGQLNFEEPYYPFRIKKVREKIQENGTVREIERDVLVRDINYSKLPLPVEGLTLRETENGKNVDVENPAYTFTIRVSVGRELKDVVVDVFKGKVRVQNNGEELWINVDLIKDRVGSSGEVEYFTKALYRYGQEYGSATWGEFTFFLAKAAIKLLKRQIKLDREAAEAAGKEYKAPVVWLQDGQLGPFGVLKRMSDKLDSLTPAEREKLIQEDSNWREHMDLITNPETEDSLKGVIMSYTTHTFGNRGEEGEGFIHLMRIPLEFRPYFHRGGDHYDSTSGSARTADSLNGVSAMHVDGIVSKTDPRTNSIAVTNGDNLQASSSFFRDIFAHESFQKRFPGANPENPTPEQLVEEKFRAKWLLKQDKRMLELDPEFANLNPSAPVIGVYGRLVTEKTGLKRAFVEENLEVQLQRANVIIFGNVQGGEDSKRMFRYLKETQQRLNSKGYRGRLIVATGWGQVEQRFVLSATDVQVNDSDPLTEAAGFSETNVAINGGIEVTLPAPEGIYQQQGEILDWGHPGFGNFIVAKAETPGAYLKVFNMILDQYGFDPETNQVNMEKRLNFATYQATSVRLGQVLKAELTSAEYYRLFNQTVEMTENPINALVDYASGDVNTGEFFRNEWLRKSLTEALSKLNSAARFQVNSFKRDEHADVFMVPGISGSDHVNIVAIERGTRYGSYHADFTIKNEEAFQKTARLLGLENLESVTDRFLIVDAVTGQLYGAYTGKELVENGLFIGIPNDVNIQILKVIRVPANNHAHPEIEANKSTIFFSNTAPVAVKESILSLIPEELLRQIGRTKEDLVWFTPWEGFAPAERRPQSYDQQGSYLIVNKGNGRLSLSLTPTLDGFSDPLRQFDAAATHVAPAYIDLHVDNDVLWIEYGTMQSFPEAETAPYDHFNRPVFQYWYLNQFKPWARSLGFGPVRIQQFELSDVQLTALGFRKISDRIGSQAPIWETHVDVDTIRTETRSIAAEHIIRPVDQKSKMIVSLDSLEQDEALRAEVRNVLKKNANNNLLEVAVLASQFRSGLQVENRLLRLFPENPFTSYRVFQVYAGDRIGIAVDATSQHAAPNRIVEMKRREIGATSGFTSRIVFIGLKAGLPIRRDIFKILGHGSEAVKAAELLLQAGDSINRQSIADSEGVFDPTREAFDSLVRQLKLIDIAA